MFVIDLMFVSPELQTQDSAHIGARCAVNRVPIDMKVQECCMKDDSRSITVAVQAEAVNHLPVPV